jgi:hypothetical protein
VDQELEVLQVTAHLLTYLAPAGVLGRGVQVSMNTDYWLVDRDVTCCESLLTSSHTLHLPGGGEHAHGVVSTVEWCGSEVLPVQAGGGVGQQHK